MKKYVVTIYHETYTEYNVTAKSEDEANELAMNGEFDDIADIYVKSSEVITTVEYVD